MAGKKPAAHRKPGRQVVTPARTGKCPPRVKADPARRTKLTKTERVRHIVDLMTSGQFVTARTTHELAVEWGMNETLVAQDTAEASRVVRGALQSPEEIRSRMAATLEDVIRRSMGKKLQGRTVVEAIKVHAALTGAEAPKQSKVEVSGNLAALLALAKSEEDDENAAATDGGDAEEADTESESGSGRGPVDLASAKS